MSYCLGNFSPFFAAFLAGRQQERNKKVLIPGSFFMEDSIFTNELPVKMKEMKTSVDRTDLRNPHGITGIYVNLSNRNVGLPVFRQKDQEIQEQPASIELWQKNGDGKMHFIKSWRKRNISHIECVETPNTWVPTRHFFNI